LRSSTAPLITIADSSGFQLFGIAGSLYEMGGESSGAVLFFEPTQKDEARLGNRTMSSDPSKSNSVIPMKPAPHCDDLGRNESLWQHRINPLTKPNVPQHWSPRCTQSRPDAPAVRIGPICGRVQIFNQV
jgi:hypothetical protein